MIESAPISQNINNATKTQRLKVSQILEYQYFKLSVNLVFW